MSDSEYNNKTFYGLYQYNTKFGFIFLERSSIEKNGKMLCITENKNKIIEVLENVYNKSMDISYNNVLLFRVKNINPYLLNYESIISLPPKIGDYKFIIIDGKTHFLNRFLVKSTFKITNYNDIIHWYDILFNRYNDIKQFSHKNSLKNFIYENSKYIRHYIIMFKFKNVLKLIGRKIIKNIFITTNISYKWHLTKKYMIKCILAHI